ncbi:MAG TPA: M1 family metallopeptidase [Kofleriaceae bacterium]|nr:M1 family metallopeptidase [Kofleriaceae bacterium]
MGPTRMKVGFVVIACGLLACKSSPRAPVDPHSFAEPDRVSVRALTLDLTVDFGKKTLEGTAKLDLKRVDHSAQLVLDDEGLVINGVTDCDGKKLGWHVGPHINIGAPLRIDLGAPTECVVIAYRTSPDAGALLWVEPSGTFGQEEPMLFTQSESILARTWIPLQDTPSVRFTYRATIHTPLDMRALMSGENGPEHLGTDAWTVEQKQPIPSYLMALAVGHFTFRPTGPRSGIFAEPQIADAAANEFAEVEAMINAAEKLYGPYRWGRYDMLVLPPSFPLGGMVNPNLTFLSPTVITGDRALVGLIAHELAHSWSGNLVTNKTWNDVWLNEGITTYVEHRIMEELRGREYSDLLWYIASRDIDETLAEKGSANQETSLAHAYGRTIAPDDFPGDLAYDKGALFMRTLEEAYGRETFDKFLRGWFDGHAFQPADSKMFAAEVKRVLGTKVDVDAWIYKGGIPAGAAPTPSAIATKVDAAASAFATSGTLPDASTWATMQWVVFLRALPKTVTAAQLDALDAAFHLTTTKNSEIAMHWLPLLVNADDRTGAPAIETFLLTVGRRRMVMPLYEAMHDKGEWWFKFAKGVFEQAKPMYHPITRESVAQLLANKADR